MQKGGWTPEYNYSIAIDSQPIASPCMPGILTNYNRSFSSENAATSRLNILFTLPLSDRLYHLFLLYCYEGTQSSKILLDQVELTDCFATEKCTVESLKIELGVVQPGDHKLTITLSGDEGYQKIQSLQLYSVSK